jgi:hemerythrin
MAFFEWNDGYSVGIASLDAQHKVLINLINRLNDIEQRGGSLTDVLNRLDWYVQYHFSFEEALLTAVHYRGLQGHIAEHRDFERWLRGSRRAVRAGGAEAREMGMIINNYLKDWLSQHILIVDMDYKSVLTAAANRGASLRVLANELTDALAEIEANPSAEAIGRAKSLASDIKLCCDLAGDA